MGGSYHQPIFVTIDHGLQCLSKNASEMCYINSKNVFVSLNRYHYVQFLPGRFSLRRALPVGSAVNGFYRLLRWLPRQLLQGQKTIENASVVSGST